MKILYYVLFIIGISSNLFANIDDNVELLFTRFDMNEDGLITEREVAEWSVLDFKVADKNKDNKLSKKELYSHLCNTTCKLTNNCECVNDYDENKYEYLKNTWMDTDANRDGYITLSEKYRKDLFDFRSYNNNDGELTRNEYRLKLESWQ